jgi:hypothetical protein
LELRANCPAFARERISLHGAMTINIECLILRDRAAWLAADQQLLLPHG